MNTYEKITFKKDGRKHAIILRNPKGARFLAGSHVITGTEVDEEGTAVGTDKVSQRLHLIDATLIVQRQPLKMNLRYGRLEED